MEYVFLKPIIKLKKKNSKKICWKQISIKCWGKMYYNFKPNHFYAMKIITLNFWCKNYVNLNIEIYGSFIYIYHNKIIKTLKLVMGETAAIACLNIYLVLPAYLPETMEM